MERLPARPRGRIPFVSTSLTLFLYSSSSDITLEFRPPPPLLLPSVLAFVL